MYQSDGWCGKFISLCTVLLLYPTSMYSLVEMLIFYYLDHIVKQVVCNRGVENQSGLPRTSPTWKKCLTFAFLGTPIVLGVQK